MRGFLFNVASALYKQYGDDISSLNIIFPNKRARLFFTEALSEVADKPLWQPAYLSIDEAMTDICGLRATDKIRLITELYKVYSKYHKETFDKFYFWGEVLLADFDTVDKYLIDAKSLFTNISDIKLLETDVSYLTESQREIVLRFWKNLGHDTADSLEKKRFFEIWNTLWDIYRDFKSVLNEKGLAYTGMVHRCTAEAIRQGKVCVDEKKRYVVAGFNALTECEKILFRHLSSGHHTDFFWDYDKYYLDDPAQEAGLFIRENLRLFPQSLPTKDDHASFTREKNIRVISSPSDSLQCKYVSRFLDNQSSNGQPLSKDTAIVLTNENLLVPVLYSIPYGIDKINVTMGYPLKQSLAYSFTERLIELQLRKRTRKGRLMFYHSDVLGLLSHPFLCNIYGEKASEIISDIVSKQTIYVDGEKFTHLNELLPVFCLSGEDPSSFADYLTNILEEAGSNNMLINDNADTDTSPHINTILPASEFINVVTDSIYKLKNSLAEVDVEISPKVFASLVRRVLQSVRMPFEGEPLEGIQVMGILETRTLDFKNIVILSVNDDTFPGNRASSPSFIPYNLRLGYGLPTPQHHEGVYAYYFYRLLQRAQNIDLVYCSKSDEKSSGEQSRYIYQLDYESPHHLNRQLVGVDVNLPANAPLAVGKDNEIMLSLAEFLTGGKRKLSPSSLYNYVTCPLKFYYYSVLRIKPEKEVSAEIDAPSFGSILHKSMQTLYSPLMGMDEPQTKISSLINSENVKDAVRDAIKTVYFHNEDIDEEDYSGNLILIRDTIVSYINRSILPFDAGYDIKAINDLEKVVSTCFRFTSKDGQELSIDFEGNADRIDTLKNGILRVVDYKTGGGSTEFKGMDALFSDRLNERNSAVFQTFMYSMFMSEKLHSDIQPALYFVRQMAGKDYCPSVLDKLSGNRVLKYSAYDNAFRNNISSLLRDIFDDSIPFYQCEDAKNCKYCDYNIICRRSE